MSDHHHGIILWLLGLIVAFLAWGLAHIQQINGVMQFLALCLSAAASIFAIRKLRR